MNRTTKSVKLINLDISNVLWGNSTLFHRAKSIEKKILRKDKYLHNQLRKAF